MTFKTMLICFLQTEALPPANETVFYDSMILEKGPPQAPRLSIWIVAQRTLLPPFESNLKTRHYEYALDFYGTVFYSCVYFFHFSFLYITIFPKRQPFLFEKQCLFIQIICLFYSFILCFFIYVFSFFYYYSIFFHSLILCF